MRDQQSDKITALVPIGEQLPDDTSGLPELHWEPIQRVMWAFQDWAAEMRPYVRQVMRTFADAWQSSGLADLVATLVEREQQRQRINAAKRRARIVTRARGAKGSKRHG